MEHVVDQRPMIDSALLTPIVRQATGLENLRLEEWQTQAVTGGFEQGSAVLRLSGLGTSTGMTLPWTVILKVIRPGLTNTAGPQASHFWRREPLYYQSGILANLPAGLRAPRCFGVFERPDGADGYWLFLEEVRDLYGLPRPDHGWPFEYYRTAARCLGRFNGAYLMGLPIPQADWIPRGWLRAYIEEAARNIDLFFNSLDVPFYRRALSHAPAGVLDVLRKAWDERYEFLDALDRLPQVLCHQDAFCRNLFAECAPDGRDQLVAVDWSYAGPAALGSELGAFVFGGMALGTIPFSESERFGQQVVEGYLEGLGDAGWRGDPDLVRFGFAASAVWRYVFGAGIGEAVPGILDEHAHPAMQQAFGGMTMDQIADFWATSIAWDLRMYEEAWRLKKQLHL